MRNAPCSLWIFVALMLCGCGTIQQAPGTVTGVVHGVKHYDSTKIGPPLANHGIILNDSDDGTIAARVRTDADGKFTITVPPGKYSIWGGEEARYVKIRSGQTSVVDIIAPE
jgi:hypothetical protein